MINTTQERLKKMDTLEDEAFDLIDRINRQIAEEATNGIASIQEQYTNEETVVKDV